MAGTFYQERCRVLANRTVGRGFFLLTLEGQRIARAARPGQFTGIRVPEPQHEPRAYDTPEELAAAARGWPPHEWPLVRRPFSFYDADGAAGTFVVHGQAVGRGTERLARSEPGETLDCLGPLGRPLPLDDPTEWAILVGGGVGIAPYGYAARKLAAAGRQVLVLCGAREPALLPLLTCEKPPIELPGGTLPGSELGLEEFEAVGWRSACSLDRDAGKGYPGRVTDLLEAALDRLTGRSAVIHACGPTPMLRAVAGVTERRKVPCWLLLEEFMGCGAGACMSCVVKIKKAGAPGGWEHQRVCVEGPAFRAEEVAW